MALRHYKGFERLYGIDRWYRQHFTGTGQFFVLVCVASGVLGFDTFRNLSYQIFCLALAFLLLSVLVSRFHPCRLSCARRLPAMATVGMPVKYSLRVNNVSGSTYSDLFVQERFKDQYPSVEEMRRYKKSEKRRENWFDALVGYPRWTRVLKQKAGAYPPRQTIAVLPPAQSVELSLSMTPVRRGYIRFEGLSIGRPGPTGLFRSVLRVEQGDTLLVLPKRYPVANLNLGGTRHHQQGGVAMSSSVGETGEFHGLREYQTGDPLRRIHWRSWARQGKPMVKTYEDEFFVRHALILDTYAAGTSHKVFEAAVSVAASIAVNVSDQESLLDLMFVEDKAYHFTSGRSVGDVQSMLEILACVQARTGRSVDSLEKLVMQHVAQLSSAVLVFLDWDESRQRLVEKIQAHGIEVRAVLVEQSQQALDVDFDSVTKQSIVRLDADQIEQGLRQLK